ncbi:hypothetical protein BJV78DRAFT_1248692 [Lactifluus subvellereus]|nr:hypothetical protein BJV78DRAFT_1248692 [Lactifluus subvellereus]
MEIDLCLPSFHTMRKRSRSRSPTPCEHDRPLKRSFVPTLAVGDGTLEPPLSFASPHTPSPTSPIQVQALSALLLVPRPPQSVCIPAVDAADANVQDEQWVALTRGLTLLSARGTTEYETAASGSGEENMMNLDEPPFGPSTLLDSHAQHPQHEVQEPPWIRIDNTAPQVLNPHPDPCMPGLPLPRLTLPAAVTFLRAPTPPTLHTPPLSITPLPPHSHFSGAGTDTPPLTRQELQQLQQQIPAPARRSRFTMGPRPDCDKCRLGVPGHYAHFD